jgi:hypothetical protein
MKMEIPEIKWSEKIAAIGPMSWSGACGKLKLFHIHYSMVRGEEFTLRCTLPGIKDAVPVKTVNEGKATAQKMLAVFLHRLYEVPRDAEES